MNIKKKDQKGFTLLEYCAGAAIIAGVVFVALSNLGGGLRTYLERLSDWVEDRSTDFRNADGTQTNPGE